MYDLITGNVLLREHALVTGSLNLTCSLSAVRVVLPILSLAMQLCPPCSAKSWFLASRRW